MSWRSRTYDELPAPSIRRADLRRALRIVTMAWMFGIVWGTLVGGDQTRILGIMLGFQDWHFSMMTALAPLATLGQVLSAVLIERTGLRKYQFMEFGAIGRLLWLSVAAIPLFFVLPSAGATYAMMVVLLTSYFCDALATPAWLCWMVQLIPRRVRGRYFAVRQNLTQCVQIVTVIIAASILDAVTAPQATGTSITATSQPALLRTVCILFMVSALFGVTDILLFRGIRDVLPTLRQAKGEPPALDGVGKLGRLQAYTSARPPADLRMLLDPLKNRVFRHYVLFGATLAFSNTLPSWFYWRNCRENLGFSSLATSILFLALSPLIQILCSRAWGRAIDRWGRRPVLIIGGVGIVLTVIPYLVASPTMSNPAFFADSINWIAAHVGGAINWAGHLVGAKGSLVGLQWADYHTPISSYLIILFAVAIGAVAWAGVNLAINALVLGFADGQGRSNYIAAQSFFINMGGLAGALLGWFTLPYLAWLHKTPIRLGPFLWNEWHMTFLLSMVARYASLFWLKGMPDPGSAKVGDLLRSARANLYGNLVGVVHFPLRVFGWKPGGGGGEGGNHDARD